MALKFGLRYKNADSTMDLNLRLKDVAEKGIVSGGVVAPGAGVREITITPFVCITTDGGVVRSDATHSITPLVDGQKTYIVLRAKYNVMSSTTLSIQALSAAAYAGDPDIAWLHVIATVDLTIGGPYALVPAANVSYVERHAVDPQRRSQYRPHVATAATLATAAYLPPLADNRSGDLVYAMDTGSFYEWTGSAWVVADDGAITHRDTEHSNGVVGDSAANTLGTGAAGTDITINAVAGGSGYTVNGRYLTSITPTTLAASTAGITRGLIQVAVDQTGAATASYRAALLGVLNLPEVQIVDISDSHPLGNFVIQTSSSLFISWDGGQPFEYNTGDRTRIFSADNKSYIDVIVTGVPANTTDTYTVSASANTDTSLLLCYAFWAGAVTLVYGKNKVPFGTTGDANISTAFKENVIDARSFDGRGDGVVSGGDCQIIAGPTIQVLGPVLICYLAGKRYSVPVESGGSKGFVGFPLPANGTRYLYVDSAGALQFAALFPSALPYATIASVTTVASVVTEFSDTRNTSLTISKQFEDEPSTGYSKDVRLSYESHRKRLEMRGSTANIFSAPSLDASRGYITSSDSNIRFQEENTQLSGSITATNLSPTVLGVGSSFLSECPIGTRLRFASQTPYGHLYDNDSTAYTVLSVASDTSMTLTGVYNGLTSSDKVAQRPQHLASAVDDNISSAQPLNASPSIISAIIDGQRAHRAGLGCLGVNACPVTFDAGLSTVTIGTGEFFDFYGRRIVVTAPVVFTTGEITPLANGAYEVGWDSDLNGSGGFDLGGIRRGFTSVHGSLQWRRSLAFAVVNKAGGLLTAVSQCQLYATGSLCQEEFSIGSDAGTTATYGRNGNFTSLKKALVFRSCYGGSFSGDLYTAPRQFAVYDQAAEVNDLIDFASFEFNNSVAASHLDGLHIYGKMTASTSSVPSLRWGAVGVISTVPMLDLTNQVSGIRFSNLRFEYLGNEGVDNDNCWLKNPGANMVVNNVSFSAVHPLYCLANYTTTASLGGERSNSHVPPTSFRDCTFGNIASGTEMFALTTANMTGRMSFHNCTVASNTSGDIAGVSRIINIADAGSSVDVSYTGGLLGTFNSNLIESAATSGHYNVSGATINAFSAAALGPTVGRMFITNCVIGTSASTAGVQQMKGCRTEAATTMTGDSITSFSDCDFSTAGFFTGEFKSMNNVRANLSTTGEIVAAGAGLSKFMTNVVVTKSNGNGQSNTAISTSATLLNLFMTDVYVSYTGTSDNTAAAVNVLSDNVYLNNVSVDVTNRFAAALHTDGCGTVSVTGGRLSSTENPFASEFCTVVSLSALSLIGNATSAVPLLSISGAGQFTANALSMISNEDSFFQVIQTTNVSLSTINLARTSTASGGTAIAPQNLMFISDVEMFTMSGVNLNMAEAGVGAESVFNYLIEDATCSNINNNTVKWVDVDGTADARFYFTVTQVSKTGVVTSLKDNTISMTGVSGVGDAMAFIEVLGTTPAVTDFKAASIDSNTINVVKATATSAVGSIQISEATNAIASNNTVFADGVSDTRVVAISNTTRGAVTGNIAITTTNSATNATLTAVTGNNNNNAV